MKESYFKDLLDPFLTFALIWQRKIRGDYFHGTLVLNITCFSLPSNCNYVFIKCSKSICYPKLLETYYKNGRWKMEWEMVTFFKFFRFQFLYQYQLKDTCQYIISKRIEVFQCINHGANEIVIALNLIQ